MKPITSSRLRYVLVLAAFCAFMAAIQFSTNRLAGTDGFFHIKTARLILEKGPFIRHFPYMRHTVFETNWCDLHFALHLLQAPFTLLPLALAAKLSAALFGALALFSFYVLCRKLDLAHSELWALLLAGSSFPFLYRLNMPRSQSLSVILLMVFLVYWFDRSYRALFCVAFIYAWSYQVCLILAPMAFLLTAASFPFRGSTDWKAPASTIGGLVAGHILNPFFPNNLLFVYWHVIIKTLNQTRLNVGGEWGSYGSWFLFTSSWPAWTAWIFAAGLFVFSELRCSQRSGGLFLLSILFMSMALRHKKFIEYWPLFAMLFAASTFDDFSKRPGPSQVKVTGKVLVFLYICCMGLAWTQGEHAARDIASCLPPTRYRGAARWLATHTPAGSPVFTTDWDDMPELFFYNDHNYYMVALDPHFLYLHDPELYRLWDRIGRGRISRPADYIKYRFGAEWIFTEAGHAAFIRRADRDPRLKRMYSHQGKYIYKVVDDHETKDGIDGLVEAEALTPPLEHSDRPFEIQDLHEMFGLECSNSQHLLFRAARVGDFISLELPVARSAFYRLVIYQTCAPDFGVIDVYLDDRLVARNLDGYSPSVAVKKRCVKKTFRLTAGAHTIRFVTIGRTKLSKGFYIGIDAIGLEPGQGHHLGG